ncbi:zinc-ribbon domain-containing protein [Roseinatronobacter sp. NSM]|uniref:zinc-ribbon domain-containing protein n=1 Tax=Roseinatronobacter sp. NSM TaxID=3457785 RepID=UPI00403527A2
MMRITCPSCLAQYEIDASLLSKDGREVQCSGCSHIWFQQADSAAPKPQTPPAPPPPATDTADQNQGADPKPAEEDDKTGLFDTTLKPRSRRLDPSVADVLREEAQFEASQRQREAEGLQSQPDLGLLASAPWPAPHADPTTPDTEAAPKTDTPAGPQAAFPDIDDISATLEPIGEARKHSDFALPQTAQARQRSFLRGFAVPPLLAMLMVGFYVMAPHLVAVAPFSAPVVSAYVGVVDSARAGLQNMLAGL